MCVCTQPPGAFSSFAFSLFWLSCIDRPPEKKNGISLCACEKLGRVIMQLFHFQMENVVVSSFPSACNHPYDNHHRCWKPNLFGMFFFPSNFKVITFFDLMNFSLMLFNHKIQITTNQTKKRKNWSNGYLAWNGHVIDVHLQHSQTLYCS